MNVLVTGSNGFIGGNLVSTLQKDHSVFVWEKEDYNGYWDVQLDSLLRTEQIDTIFHVGADSSTRSTDVNSVMFLNYTTTKFLSDWAKKYRKKFIFSSSAAVYGLDSEPNTLYGWSKKFAEDYVTNNGQISLRYFNCFGPGEKKKGHMASVAYQSWEKSKDGIQVSLFEGCPRRDFVYVKDVVDANIYADDKYDELEKKAYEVGSGEARPFEDVLSLMGIPYNYINNPYKDYQDFTKAYSAYFMRGWKPKFDLEKGIEDYLTYLSNK